MRLSAVALMFAAAVLAGCATPERGSTRLTHADFDDTVQAMVTSLASSKFLAGRTPDSPQIRIVTNKVENLTSDVITAAEQWMLIARVQAAFPVQELAQKKNIVFQIPPEEAALLREKGFDSPLNPEHEPTHLMIAVFRSSTSAGSRSSAGFADVRKEYYFVEYTIIEIKSRKTAWSGSFEFAREASGLLID